MGEPRQERLASQAFMCDGSLCGRRGKAGSGRGQRADDLARDAVYDPRTDPLYE